MGEIHQQIGQAIDQAGGQVVVRSTDRIDWRKLLFPALLVMVIPTISAIVVDKWLGFFPLITIVTILICFPAATIWVTRNAMKEMDRVIAAVAPPPSPLSLDTQSLDVASAEPVAADFSPQENAGADITPAEAITSA